MSVLSASHMSVGYDGRAIVRDVNIKADKGEMICLLGPNGAGKSTILKTLAGTLPPISGNVLLNGRDMSRITSVERAKVIAVVLTEKVNLPLTSVEELTAMGRIPYTNFFGRLTQNDKDAIASAIRNVGIERLSKRNYMNLSDGEQQKALIARALAQEPEVIILDEPTNHLDVSSRVEIMQILSRSAYSKGLAIVLSLHDIDIALQTCQTILAVRDGRVTACGTPEDIFTNGELEKLYGIEGASCDFLTGSIEPHNKREPQAYVVAGCGFGSLCYRALGRLRVGVVTGILFENDIDRHIAGQMGLEIISVPAFYEITKEDEERALNRALSAAVLVDSGFPSGEKNEANLRVIRKFLKHGGRVISRRSNDEAERLFGTHRNITCAAKISEIASLAAEAINHRKGDSNENKMPVLRNHFRACSCC